MHLAALVRMETQCCRCKHYTTFSPSRFGLHFIYINIKWNYLLPFFFPDIFKLHGSYVNNGCWFSCHLLYITTCLIGVVMSGIYLIFVWLVVRIFFFFYLTMYFYFYYRLILTLSWKNCHVFPYHWIWLGRHQQ